MFKIVRDISSEDPVREVWKYLRFFLDSRSVEETICRIHNLPDKRDRKNAEKQAKQIGYCIRQAEEYFKASSQVGLATRPLLLYYGAVSLSQALFLLRQDGNHSLDVLRKQKKHKHHGLIPIEDSKTHTASNPRDFFNSIRCRLYLNRPSYSDGNQEASLAPRPLSEPSVKATPIEPDNEESFLWGQFPLFYRSLVAPVVGVHVEFRDVGFPTSLQQEIALACADLLPLRSLIHTSLNAVTIMQTLPDMFFALAELGIQPNLCRGSMRLVSERYYESRSLNAVDDSVPGSGPERGNEQPNKIINHHDFFIDGITFEQKAHLLNHYAAVNPEIALIADFGTNLHLKWDDEYIPPAGTVRHYPDMVEDISGRKFYILEPETYLPEPAALYVLLFSLGMLSRYAPDVWMKSIEKVQIAELTNSLLNVAYRKLPNLILDQMTCIKHRVHL